MEVAPARLRRTPRVGTIAVKGCRSELMPGTTGDVGEPTSVTEGGRIGRYRVDRLLGAGGMGEVWAARDEQLGRDVAIKVLPGHFAARSERALRFEREARAAAALDHPHILAVHDVGTWRGRPFIVTELLEGETLRVRIRSGDLTTRKAVELGVQIATGLGAAHDRGIVHRDLKPENVFVTQAGSIKILDFGLVKLGQQETASGEVTAAGSDASPTVSGVAMGTPGYMAPEQVRGQAVDHRADVFALGCVLHEMLAGEGAFRRDTPAETMLAILAEDPGPLPQNVPGPVGAIVHRCLEKRPEDRFQSARDVAYALRGAIESAPGTGPRDRPARPRRTVSLRLPLAAIVSVVLLGVLAAAAYVARQHLGAAQLPGSMYLAMSSLEAGDGDGELRTVATGLREVVEEGLRLVGYGTSGESWVVPHREAEQLEATSTLEIGRTFNATLVVTGRLQRRRDRLRLLLEAVDPGSGRICRTVAIEDSAGNLSPFQEEPVTRLAEALGIPVAPWVLDRMAETATTMPSAFDSYLRGRGLLTAAEAPEEVDRAIGLFEEAVGADPLFAMGWIALARSCGRRFDLEADPQWIERGLGYAEQARQTGGRVDLAWRTTAALQLAAGRPEEAVESLEEAVRLAPRDPEALLELATALQASGRLDDAEPVLRRAIYLRPDYWVGYDRIAKLYYVRGQYEAAATEFRHVIRCAPEFALGYIKLGSIMVFLERVEDGRRLFERSVEIKPTYYGLANLGSLHFNASRFADAAAMYERALAIDDSDYALWGNLAYAYRYGSKPGLGRETFRRAAEMGEERLLRTPDDLALRTNVADYYAMLEEPERGLELIDPVVAAEPTEPQLIANVAECLWDLGSRERAIAWVERAFDAGIPRSRFEGRPTLRDMVADERYRALVQDTAAAAPPDRGTRT